MKKSLFPIVFLSVFFPIFNISSIKELLKNTNNNGVTVINKTESKAEGGNATSRSSTTVNGQTVTVETSQSGSVEVKNTDGKVEIKTSGGITPTIIVTGIPSQSIIIEESDKILSVESPSEKLNLALKIKKVWEDLLRFFRVRS